LPAASKKRASPGADEQKNLFDVDISDEMHSKLQDIDQDILRAELANDRDALKRLTPVYEKRRALVKGIPKFWPVALMQHAPTSALAQHRDDQQALLYLEDLWVERDPVESRAFTLEFHFAENPYFSDAVLKKEYKYVPPPAAKDEKPDEHGITPSMLDFAWDRDVAPQAIKISWKSDTKNLTKLYPRIMDDEDVSEPGSFFNFFEHDDDPLETGIIISNEIFPDAIDWFTGKAAADDLDLSDDEDDEDDDDDDAEAEIDLTRPETKRPRRN